MVDTFYIPFSKKVDKEHHLVQEANAFGTHDRFYFTPATEGRIRCFKCNRLFDSTLLDTGKCPQCLYTFTKAEARDAYIESVYHKVNYGKWNDVIVQALGKLTQPGIVRPDGHVVPLTDSARKVVEYYVAKLRQYTAEDNSTPADVYRMRASAINAELNKPFQPRRV